VFWRSESISPCSEGHLEFLVLPFKKTRKLGLDCPLWLSFLRRKRVAWSYSKANRDRFLLPLFMCYIACPRNEGPLTDVVFARSPAEDSDTNVVVSTNVAASFARFQQRLEFDSAVAWALQWWKNQGRRDGPNSSSGPMHRFRTFPRYDGSNSSVYRDIGMHRPCKTFSAGVYARDMSRSTPR